MDLTQYAPALDVFHDAQVLRFTKVTQPSGYVGDTYSWQPAGTLQCGKYPVTDERSIEMYGPRVNQMFRLHFAPGTSINDGDGIAFDVAATEPDYTVVGVKPRKTHTLVIAEVIGVGNQD